MLFEKLREACNLAFLDGENISLILDGMAYIVQTDPIAGVLHCYLLATPSNTPVLTEHLFNALGLVRATPSSISARYFQAEMLDAN